MPCSSVGLRRSPTNTATSAMGWRLTSRTATSRPNPGNTTWMAGTSARPRPWGPGRVRADPPALQAAADQPGCPARVRRAVRSRLPWRLIVALPAAASRSLPAVASLRDRFAKLDPAATRQDRASIGEAGKAAIPAHQTRSRGRECTVLCGFRRRPDPLEDVHQLDNFPFSEQAFWA
jgi:hypothetical protein